MGQSIADGFFGNQTHQQQPPPNYGQPVYGQPLYGQQPMFLNQQANYAPQQQQVIIVNNNSHGEYCQVCARGT